MKKMKRISRAKFENIAYLSHNIINIATYIMIFAASILKAKEGSLADIIQAIYCSIISFLLILHEFKSPAWTQIYFGFLCIHRGKGLLMLFLGCLVMCKTAFNIIVAIIAFTIGFAYFIMSLVPSLPPPNGFLIHWQNHKDFWAEGLDLSIPPNNTTSTVMTSRLQYDSNNNFVSLPHPSAWHPSPSTLDQNAYNNMDYSKFQSSSTQKGNTKKYVIY